jgi:hypothetical protein
MILRHLAIRTPPILLVLFFAGGSFSRPCSAEPGQQKATSSGTAASAPLTTAVAASVPGSVAADPRSPRQAMMLGRVWGVDDIHVQETSSGALLKFTYRIIDANKAKLLNDKNNTPYMIVQKNGAKLEIPTTEKVGKLRQVATPENGRAYWMVFGNGGNMVKPGDRVDVVIAAFRASGLVVEASQVPTARKP